MSDANGLIAGTIRRFREVVTDHGMTGQGRFMTDEIGPVYMAISKDGSLALIIDELMLREQALTAGLVCNQQVFAVKSVGRR